MASNRRNPIIGYQPDLLPRRHRRPAGEIPPGAQYPLDEAREAAGETPIFVDLASMTAEQLAQLPVKAFTPDEWGELDEDLQEEIFENDASSRERIDEFVDIFVSQWMWAQDPSRSDFNEIEDGFEHWLSSQGDSLWMAMPTQYLEAIVNYANENAVEVSITYGGHGYRDPRSRRFDGWAGEQVRDAINSAMENSNRYEIDMDTDDPVYDEERHGHLYVEPSEYRREYDALAAPELERALESIAKKTNHDISIDENDLDRNRAIDVEWETGVVVKMGADWAAIEAEVRGAIDELVPKGAGAEAYEQLAAALPEERIVHRWPDGFYVQDLLTEELPAEGETQGMCVGRPEMGYMRALENGEIKIMSLRRPSGKPLFTFELHLGPGGVITQIKQIKGKANRVPGFDRGKEGPYTPIKRDEVERVIEFIEGPLVEYTRGQGRRRDAGIAFEDVDDLTQAARQVWDLFRKGDPWAKKLLVDKLKLERASAPVMGAAPPEKLRGNPASSCGVHGARCGGFCQPYRRASARVNPSKASRSVAESEETRHARKVRAAMADYTGDDAWAVVPLDRLHAWIGGHTVSEAVAMLAEQSVEPHHI